MIAFLICVILVLVGCVLLLIQLWFDADKRATKAEDQLDAAGWRLIEWQKTARIIANQHRHRDIYEEVAKEMEAKRLAEWELEVYQNG